MANTGDEYLSHEAAEAQALRPALLGSFSRFSPRSLQGPMYLRTFNLGPEALAAAKF
jgi:hypothetical protein